VFGWLLRDNWLVGWLVGWGLTALSAQIGYIMPWFIRSSVHPCLTIVTLLFGVADQQLKRLQSVQNAAARLVTGTRRSDRITPVLKVLHWLPVRERIQYKMAMLVHKCLNERAPEYLITDCC